MPLKITKNNSQGIIFVIISCQRVPTELTAQENLLVCSDSDGNGVLGGLPKNAPIEHLRQNSGECGPLSTFTGTLMNVASQTPC